MFFGSSLGAKSSKNLRLNWWTKLHRILDKCESSLMFGQGEIEQSNTETKDLQGSMHRVMERRSLQMTCWKAASDAGLPLTLEAEPMPWMERGWADVSGLCPFFKDCALNVKCQLYSVKLSVSCYPLFSATTVSTLLQRLFTGVCLSIYSIQLKDLWGQVMMDEKMWLPIRAHQPYQTTCLWNLLCEQGRSLAGTEKDLPPNFCHRVGSTWLSKIYLYAASLTVLFTGNTRTQ